MRCSSGRDQPLPGWCGANRRIVRCSASARGRLSTQPEHSACPTTRRRPAAGSTPPPRHQPHPGPRVRFPAGRARRSSRGSGRNRFRVMPEPRADRGVSARRPRGPVVLPIRASPPAPGGERGRPRAHSSAASMSFCMRDTPSTRSSSPSA
jgi:hypothetical protein